MRVERIYLIGKLVRSFVSSFSSFLLLRQFCVFAHTVRWASFELAEQNNILFSAWRVVALNLVALAALREKIERTDGRLFMT